MSFWDLARFSFGALRGHRLRSWLSLTGVAIGVASVILLTSLGEGARLYVTSQFTSLGSNLVIVIPGKTETVGAAPFVSTAPNDLTVDDSDALLRQVREIKRTIKISMPFPEDSQSILDTVLKSILLNPERKADQKQMGFEFMNAERKSQELKATKALEDAANRVIKANIESKDRFEVIEDEVIKRTEEVLNEKQKADEANQEKTEFISHISHEIRNPINAISGFVNLLDSEVNDPGEKELIIPLKAATANLLGLVNDLLDISKAELGKLKIEYRVVDSKRVISNMTKIIDFPYFLTHIDP